jgi:dihydrofolate reductase
MAANRVIGLDGALPWRLPADLRHFKRVTMRKPVVMGRKTWQSLHVRPLPGRTNIVLTRDSSFKADETVIVHSLDEALDAAAGEHEVMVIGGEQVYRLALPLANRIYLTEVHKDFHGDARFPEFDTARWREVSREDHGAEAETPAYSFVVLDRVEMPTA